MGARRHRAPARSPFHRRASPKTAQSNPGRGAETQGRHRTVQVPRRTPRTAITAVAVMATISAMTAAADPAGWRDEDPATNSASTRGPGERGAPTPAPTREPQERLRTGYRELSLSRSATRADSVRSKRQPDWLATCQTETQQSQGANGLVQDENLCELPAGFHLRGDAAAAWARLSARYQQQFGDLPCMTDGYRSLDAQRRLYSSKPGLAATPGTSNHGWGVAVDLCGGVESFGAREHEWMLDNANRFGWINPTWARPSGSRPEPWHWEYTDRLTQEDAS